MRVIAGEAKGFPLKVPQNAGVRPATDLVRGAIFSILESTVSDWTLVLDLFSGSGAMGIEALSRGAEWADFVDRQRRCCDIIKQNLQKTRLTDRAHVYCCSVERALSFFDKEYNIVIMDPPYSDKSIGDTITKLGESRIIGVKTTVVITHSPHLTLEPEYSSLHMFNERRHGDSCIALYRKEEGLS